LAQTDHEAWVFLGLVALVLLLVVFLATRLASAQERVRKREDSLYRCWESYLDSLSVSLERLRALRAIVSQVRAGGEKSPLEESATALYQSVRAEIVVIEQQLETMTRVSDKAWHEMEIAWRPALALNDHIARLYEILAAAVGPDQLERIKAEWRRQWELEVQKRNLKYERDISDLRTRIRELETGLEEIEFLRAEVRRLKAREGAVAADSEEIERLRRKAAGVEIEEAVAARWMGGLEENKTLEQLDAEIAKADGEIHFCQNQIREAAGDAEKIARLEARRYRKHAVLMDEINVERMEPTSREGEDLETVRDFQAAEAKNADMRRRIGELSASNLQLTLQLEKFNAEAATADELRQTLAQVEMARRSAQRELDNLEKMVARMEDDLLKQGAENRKLAKLEPKIAELVQENKALKEEADRVRAHGRDSAAALEVEIESLRRRAAELQKRIDSKEVEGMVPEEEMLGLQSAYDQLNAQIVQMRGARVQAERNEKAAREELLKSHKSLGDLQKKYHELLDQFRQLNLDVQNK
jgi:chromosome segregation ATPase